MKVRSIVRLGAGVALAAGIGLAFATGPAGAAHDYQLAQGYDCAVGIPVQAMPGQTGLAYAYSIQEELNLHGYNAGVIDGIVGKRTRRAIRHYQRDYGLPVDGCATKELLDHLKFVSPRPYSARPQPADVDIAYHQPRAYVPEPTYAPVPYVEYGPPPTAVPFAAPDYAAPPPYSRQPRQYAYAPPADQPGPVYEAPLSRTYDPPEQSYDVPPSQTYDPPAQTYEPPPARYDPAGPASRSLVMEVQQELYLRGYYSGAIDGSAGQQTQAAAERFRADAGYPASDKIDQTLLNQLKSADQAIRY